MSKVRMLRALVEQRLTLAAEEIFELFERTMAEYEEELCRQGKLLKAVFQPEVRLHRADVQQLMVNGEAAPPEQQIWSPSLDQQNPPQLPNIKVEQEELWTKQEEEQLQLLEEADITKFTYTPVMTEDDEEHSGRSEPARNLNPDNHLETAANDKNSHFSEPETDDSLDWDEMRDSESGLKPLQNNEVLLSDNEINTGKTPVSSSERAANFGHKGRLQKQKHNEAQTGVSLFRCWVCGKGFDRKTSLICHMRLHPGAKRFGCSVCKKPFLWRHNLKAHMRIHTGEKPFSCSVCGKGFTQNSALTSHLRIHTGEKPFKCSKCDTRFGNSSNFYKHFRMHHGKKPYSCSFCGNTFAENWQLRQHLTTHTEDKPIICPVCGKKCSHSSTLTLHLRVHTGEKPFTCSVCGKRFAQQGGLARHSVVHTGEKPFHCSICDKRFTQNVSLKKHKCVGDNSGKK